MAIPIAKMLTIGILPSPLKVMWYRMKGAKIGKHVKIGMLSVIEADEIEIGDYTSIGFLTFINCRKIKLGKRVKIHTMAAIDTGKVFIDDDSAVMEQVVIGGMLTARSEISIGKRVKIFPYSFLNPTEKITIEDEVGIGGANYIFTHGSWQSELDGFPVGFGPVTVKKGVWFPWRVFVMPNVTVGEHATIGAGSIITKDIPARSLAAGSPAKVLRTEEQYIKKFTSEEKNTMCLGYMNAMVEHFNYLGHEANIQTTNNEELTFSATIAGKKVIISYRLNPSAKAEADITITLNAMDSSLKSSILQGGRVFFDIGSKQAVFFDKPEWYLVRDFFSRYGVRFEVVN
jgi:acetyltransferase-like isoleucine patch superfamily enzyme